MPGFERAATIDRPPRQVYAALDDLHAARHWMPAIRRIEVLTPEFAMDVGYRWRETRAVWGVFRMSADLEVVAHDPPKVWGSKYEDRRLRATATFELAPSGTGTLITLREEVTDLQGKDKRAARMASWMEKADDDLLLRLKAYVESQPAWPEEAAKPAAPKPARKPRKKTAKKATKSVRKPRKKATEPSSGPAEPAPTEAGPASPAAVQPEAPPVPAASVPATQGP